MSIVKNAVNFKIAAIVIIALLLLIPAGMIKNLIHEREHTQRKAIEEVSSKWGKEQTIKGPFISIPYHKYIKEFSLKDSVERIVKVREYLHILPHELHIEGEIGPEQRTRGIYDIVVYNSNIAFSGRFTSINWMEFDIPLANIEFDKACLVIGIDDLRGIEKQIELVWNERKGAFNPGTLSNDVVSNGINALIAIAPDDTSGYSFRFELDIKGSQLLYFTPVGKVTDVAIASHWKNPSFNGAFLPDSRQVSDTGFIANWNILHLNRNYPQYWTNSRYEIEGSLFGVDLLLPVDNYQKTYRSIQYAILFIGFTFIAFFFIETLNRVYIHPIQYILVGTGLIVFYTLLLSLSEHLTFNLAFLIASSATLSLIGSYVRAILKTGRLSLLITGILIMLYAFLFVVIQLRDFALLIGSVGVFVILGLVMFFSRKIDWYELGMPSRKRNEGTDRFESDQ